MTDRETHIYDDIIHLPHHVSKTRPQMSMHDRAAQFSAFAALVGFDAIIEETKRFTNSKVELSDYETEIINEKLMILSDNLSLHPSVTVRFFLPDERKDGGEYITFRGTVKKIDPIGQVMIFMDGSKIPLENIYSVKSDLFASFSRDD